LCSLFFRCFLAVLSLFVAHVANAKFVGPGLVLDVPACEPVSRDNKCRSPQIDERNFATEPRKEQEPPRRHHRPKEFDTFEEWI
jgi:hypothetical protein